MLGDEGALGGDVGVECVQFCTRPHHVAGGGFRGILGTAEAGRDLIDLRACLVDRGLADRGDLDSQRAVVLQESETLAREGEETAEPLLHALQTEGNRARGVDGFRTLLRLERVDAQLELLGLILQNQALGAALLLRTRMVGQLRAQADQFVREQPCLGIAHDGRDGGRLARDLRLLAEGLELSTQLPGEVAESVRFASIASSFRSVFSLRRRCFRMPAASSTKPRRSSGLACSTLSSRP